MIRRDAPDGQTIDRTPTPDDLVDAPELAILAALESTLELVVRALVCAHPELADPERPFWLRRQSRTTIAAETLADQAADMKQAVTDYCEAIELQRQDQASEYPGNLPF